MRPTTPLPPGHPHHQVPPVNTAVGYGQPTGAPPPLGMGGQPPGYTGYPMHQAPPVNAAPPPPVGGMNQYQRPHAGGELDAAGRSKAQLIVGIDFGTTFSGVAYAFATNTEAREDIITEWPGAGTHTKQKVCICTLLWSACLDTLLTRIDPHCALL